MKITAFKLVSTSVLLAVLAACGGGGGSSAPAPTSTNLTVIGTAATGLAIAGATVTGKCKVGTGTATTLADGSYTLTITDGQLPCVLQIANPVDGIKLHTVVTGTGSTATANITPLTEMATARVLGSEPNVFFAAFDAAVATQKITSTTVQSAQTDIGLVLTGTVDTTALGNFISTPLKAATQGSPTTGDAQDKLLDALKLKLSSVQIGTLATAFANNQTTDAIKQTVASMTGGGIATPVAPTANAGAAQSVVTGITVTLDASTSSAAAGKTLTYAWTLTSKPAGSTATLAAPSTAKPTFVADVAGSYVASVIVNDGTTASSAAAVTITASVTNAAPVANAGVAQNVVAGSVVTLDGSASSDANSDPLTYVWTLTSKPAGSTEALSSTTSAKPTFTADVAGTYVASLTVNDGKVNSTVATISVTAAVANVAPVANAGVAQNVVAGSVVTLDGSASSDANSDPLTYVWTLTSKPAGSSAALAPATSVAPTFTADIAGIYVLSLVVSDGKVSSSASNVTITASALKVTKVVAANFHALALKEDGSLWAWGENIYGVLGDGTNVNISVPKKIGSGYVDVYTGAYNSFGIKSDGSLWAWGWNDYGTFGDGTTQSSLTPKKVADGFTKLGIYGINYAAALKADGTLWNWSYNTLSPIKFADGFVDISVGNGVTPIPNSVANGAGVAGIKTDGSLLTWGTGYLGYGTNAQGNASPTLIGSDFKAVSVGPSHTLALKTNGDVWSWGFNVSGELGIGAALGVGVFESWVPVLVGGGFTQVSAGGDEYSTALKADGGLWAWGVMQFLPGGLGYGDSTIGSTNVPKQIGSGFTSVSSGSYFSTAIKNDGSIWVWGRNNYGSLGGSSGDGRVPQLLKF